jgi:hypothetical protein
MGNIPKANIVNGNTINAADVSNIINALDGTTAYNITISGSLAINTTQSPGSGHVITYNTSSGVFTYTSSAAIGGGGTVVTDGITITGDGSVGAPITSLTVPLGGTAAIQVDDGSGLFDGNAESLLDVKDSIIFLGSTNTKLDGQRNIIIGQNNEISGSDSVMIGISGSVIGNNSLIVGSNNIIENNNDPKNGNLIVGYNNQIRSSLNSNSAAAIGTGLIVSGSFQTVVGTYNAQGDSTSPFIVGIGSGSGSARQTGFKVTQSGSIVTKYTIYGSGVPTWTGSVGELVVGKSTNVHCLWLYTGPTNGWVSASFSG